jgi:hypothetical protein
MAWWCRRHNDHESTSPNNAQVVISGPSDTGPCEPQPPSTPRESSPSLELREVGGAFSTPLFGSRSIQAGCSNGGQESVGEQREATYRFSHVCSALATSHIPPGKRDLRYAVAMIGIPETGLRLGPVLAVDEVALGVVGMMWIPETGLRWRGEGMFII